MTRRREPRARFNQFQGRGQTVRTPTPSSPSPATPAPRDDDQPGYRRRRAWSRAKAALGPGDLAEQLHRIERSGLGCPRLLLAAAVHQFLSGGRAGSARAVRRYLASFAPAAESLPHDELTELLAQESAAGAPSGR